MTPREETPNEHQVKYGRPSASCTTSAGHFPQWHVYYDTSYKAPARVCIGCGAIERVRKVDEGPRWVAATYD